MKAFVLYGEGFETTGRYIGEMLISGLPYSDFDLGPIRYLEREHRAGKRFKYIINLGYQGKLEPYGAAVLNRPIALKAATDGRRAQSRFKLKDIPAPRVWVSGTSDGVHFPVIARSSQSAHGNGLWYCHNAPQLQKAYAKGATYAIKEVPYHTSYRIHLAAPKISTKDLGYAQYKTLRVTRRTRVTNPRNQGIYRGVKTGWVFKEVDYQQEVGHTLAEIQKAGQRALHCMKLHWGAVDIVYANNTRVASVLGVIPTPLLVRPYSTLTKAYVKAITHILGMQPSKVKEPTGSPTFTSGETWDISRTLEISKVFRALVGLQ